MSGYVRSKKMCFFFFSSRRRHTRFDCDWSSDVCSSDLLFDMSYFVLLSLGLNVVVGFAGLLDLGDRKSTRLNSSHSQISYAVFCLKKKKPYPVQPCRPPNRLPGSRNPSETA